MHCMQQQLNAGRAGLALPQCAGVLQQRTLPRSQYPQTHKGRTGSRQVAHIAAEPRQILVQDPVQQHSSPTASLSYTSFEDDSLRQSLVTLQEVCLDQEVCRLEQLLQDLSSTCSSLADKVGANAHARCQELCCSTGVHCCCAWPGGWQSHVSRALLTRQCHCGVVRIQAEAKHTQCGAFVAVVSCASNAAVCIASASCANSPRLSCTLAAVCGVHRLPSCKATHWCSSCRR